MKRILIVIALLAPFTTAVFAQEKTLLNVVYKFTYVRDLAARDAPYQANMVLSLGKNTSRYCTEKLYEDKTKSAVPKPTAQHAAPRPTIVVAGGPLLIVNKYGAIINEEVTKDIPNNKMDVCAIMGFKTYEIDADLPKINWQIQQDKKTIGRYSCQKATGSFGGREYTAWFTPDLPFRDGPWKFSGLPGLILEVEDRKNEISFVFQEITRNTNDNEKTASFLKNTGCIKTNMKSYLKTKEAFEKDPEAIMAAMAPNARLAIKNLDNADDQSVKKVKKYNPIEQYQ